jgi:hypothetical protein
MNSFSHKFLKYRLDRDIIGNYVVKSSSDNTGLLFSSSSISSSSSSSNNDKEEDNSLILAIPSSAACLKWRYCFTKHRDILKKSEISSLSSEEFKMYSKNEKTIQKEFIGRIFFDLNTYRKNDFNTFSPPTGTGSRGGSRGTSAHNSRKIDATSLWKSISDEKEDSEKHRSASASRPLSEKAVKDPDSRDSSNRVSFKRDEVSSPAMERFSTSLVREKSMRGSPLLTASTTDEILQRNRSLSRHNSVNSGPSENMSGKLRRKSSLSIVSPPALDPTTFLPVSSEDMSNGNAEDNKRESLDNVSHMSDQLRMSSLSDSFDHQSVTTADDNNIFAKREDSNETLTTKDSAPTPAIAKKPTFLSKVGKSLSMGASGLNSSSRKKMKMTAEGREYRSQSSTFNTLQKKDGFAGQKMLTEDIMRLDKSRALNSAYSLELRKNMVRDHKLLLGWQVRESSFCSFRYLLLVPYFLFLTIARFLSKTMISV